MDCPSLPLDSPLCVRGFPSPRTEEELGRTKKKLLNVLNATDLYI